jgi:deazaflavin-dependent oxidoreductase (nitroreductase family)
MTDHVDPNIATFRSNDGKVGGYFEGAHLALLTTTGAKSGAKREALAMSFTKDGAVYVIASKGGAPEHPAWYHNMLANPEVGVELSTERGVDTFEATAVTVDRAERDALYAEFAADKPGFAEYEKKTSRVIPIVELRRTV